MGVVDCRRIYKMLDASKALSVQAAWMFAIDRDVKDDIIRMNTDEQLYDEGIDSLGNPIQPEGYSPVTIILKKLKGDRYDHVTLHDEGDFYESWSVQVDASGLTIDAIDTGKYDRPLFQVYGIDVLGLTDENMEWLKKMVLEKYLEYVRKELGIS